MIGTCLGKNEVRILDLDPRFLLDTHVYIRWLAEPKKLSRDQMRVLSRAERSGEPLGVSAVTLIEIAILFGVGGIWPRVPLNDLFAALLPGGAFRIIPFDIETAKEVAAMGDMLRDPFDRSIVATARIHRLKLITSDERIIDSELVAVVE